MYVVTLRICDYYRNGLESLKKRTRTDQSNQPEPGSTPVMNIQERIRSASISVSGDDREGGSSSKTKSKYNEVVKEKENKATKSKDHQNKGARPKFQTKYAPISHFSEKYSKNRPEPPTVQTVEELF